MTSSIKWHKQSAKSHLQVKKQKQFIGNLSTWNKQRNRQTRWLNNQFNYRTKCESQCSIQHQKTSSFLPNKDKMSKNVQSNVFYKFTCDQCNDHVYVGETIRHFSTRVQEHIRGQPPSDVSLYQHVAQQRQFSIVLRTSFTTIGEALIYNTIPKEKRLNNNWPPFKLQIFEEEDLLFYSDL